MRHAKEIATGFWADMDSISARHPYDPEKNFFIGRNPFNYDDAIGHDDDRHVFLCAGTRGGKGRSIIINNLLNWRGSVVSVDPKGENANVTAARRGQGDKYCDGLGQDVFVLDPYNRAKVPKKYRASCNLLDVMNPDDGDLLSQCRILAEAMRVNQEGGESESWAKAGAEITALVMAHVKTWKHYEGERHLVKVRELITDGEVEGANELIKANIKIRKLAEEKGVKPRVYPEDPFEVMLTDMTHNEAQNGAIKRAARAKLRLFRKGGRQFTSQLENSQSETAFIDDLQMHDQLVSSEHNGRSFKLSDLNDFENGISVFLCLPDNPDHIAIRWQKAMLTLILEQRKKEGDTPTENGKKILMVLDEFASMGKMTAVSNGFNSIAGAGVKLFLIVTQIANLKDYYKDAWETITGGCGLQMYFAINDYETQKYVSDAFDETQVTLVTRNASVAKAEGTSKSTAHAEGVTFNEGGSHGQSLSDNITNSVAESETHNMGLSISDTKTWNDTKSRTDTKGSAINKSWNLSDGTSQTYSQNRSHGDSVGAQYGDFFRASLLSTNANHSTNTGTGSSKTKSKNRGVGGSLSENRSTAIGNSQSVGGSHGITHNEGVAHGRTKQESRSRGETLSSTYNYGLSVSGTTTKTDGTNESTTYTFGMQEGIHKRPLITVSEIHYFLQRVDIREHFAYPGFILIKMAGKYGGEGAFLARKCYYDQDALFEGLFTPHPNYRRNFLPKSQQRLVGGEYTPEHFVPVRLPKPVIAAAEAVQIDLALTTDDWFEEDDVLFEWAGAHISENQNRLVRAKAKIKKEPQDLDASEPLQLDKITVEERVGAPVMGQSQALAPYAGKVLDYALDEAYQEGDDIMLLRFESPLDSNDREWFEQNIFDEILRYLIAKAAAQSKLNELIEALNAEYRFDWARHQEDLQEQAERARKAKEAEEKRRAEEERLAKEKLLLETLAKEKKDRQMAVEAEQETNKKRFKPIIWAFWIIIPLFYVFIVTAQALIAPGSFDYQENWDRTESWKFAWNKPSVRQCGSTYTVLENRGLYYTYRCSKLAGIDTSHPVSSGELFWHIIRMILISFAIILGIVLFNLSNAVSKFQSDDEDKRYYPDHHEFSGQMELVFYSASEIFDRLYENRGRFWLCVAIFIGTMALYNQLTADIYKNIR